MWLLHEVVAHWDVHYATPLRRISIWEVHVHNYMATVPLYLLMLIIVLNWAVAVQDCHVPVDRRIRLAPAARAAWSAGYLARVSRVFMAVFCVFPYLEENIRCLRYASAAKVKAL